MLTKYPLGVVRCCRSRSTRPATTSPPRCSRAPFALDFNDSDAGLAAFYVVAGVAVLAVSLITNYQYSPKRGTAKAATSPA